MDRKKIYLVCVLAVLAMSGFLTACSFLVIPVNVLSKESSFADQSRLSGAVLPYESFNNYTGGYNLNWNVPEPDKCYETELFRSQDDSELVLDNTKIFLVSNDSKTAWRAKYGNATIEVLRDGGDLILHVRDERYERALRESDI